MEILKISFRLFKNLYFWVPLIITISEKICIILIMPQIYTNHVVINIQTSLL